MPEAPLSASLTEAVALLERAVGYGRAALGGVTDDLLSRPTPCRRWDLATLLAHMEDSLAAMAEAAEVGDVGLEPVRSDGGPAAGGAGATVERLRVRACALLGGWAVRATPVTVGGQPLAAEVFVHAGALDIAVHAWDVTRACGIDRPLPSELAIRLLELAPTLVADEDRGVRFGQILPVFPQATAAERLLAFVGRRA